MVHLQQLKIYILVFFSQILPSLEHARLMEPPSRASMWRLGFPTPVDQVKHKINENFSIKKI